MPVRFDEFEHQSRETWMTKADVDLKGAKSANDIRYDIEFDLAISPFLTRENNTGQQNIKLPKTAQGYIIASPTNESILGALENGANALWIELTSADDLSVVFKDVIIDIITLVIDDRKADSTERQKIKAFFGQNDNITYIPEGCTYLPKDATFVERIAIARNNITEPITLELKDDFLAQIAELRALRILGANTIYAFSDYQGSQLEGQGVLIAHTYQLMAAYLGGANIAFGPMGTENDIARLGLNIQHILGLESNINHVNDPMAGAYVVDEMVKEMIGVISFKNRS